MKPTWIAAASAFSTSVRCSGATAGRWPARTSRPALTRSSRRGRARRSSSPSRVCRSAGFAAAAAAAHPGQADHQGSGGGGRARCRRARRRRQRGGAARSAASADSRAGGVARLGKLAGRAGGRAHVSLHAPGAAAVDDRAGRECRWLPRVAVLQDHDRRYGSHPRGDGGSRAGRPASFHRRGLATAAGGSTSSRMAPTG